MTKILYWTCCCLKVSRIIFFFSTLRETEKAMGPDQDFTRRVKRNLSSQSRMEVSETKNQAGFCSNSIEPSI